MRRLHAAYGFAPLVCLLLAWTISAGSLLIAGEQPIPAQGGLVRPHYAIEVNMDVGAHRLNGVSTITIPATEADSLADLRFVLYANAIDGLDRDGKPPIEIQTVRLGANPVPWGVNGAEMTVALPGSQTRPFDLTIEFKAYLPQIRPVAANEVPKEEESDPNQGDGGPPDRAKNEDYGLFGYSDDVLSLGSFWYPQLAVRREGAWIRFGDPGPGDLLHAETSDFEVAFGGLPDRVTVVASGTGDGRKFRAEGVRDFAVLIGGDYVSRSTDVKVGRRSVRVTSFTKAAHKGRLATTLEIGAAALRCFERRFGPYPFDELKIVEAPLRGGSGGMEYSGVVSVATKSYEMLGKGSRAFPKGDDSAAIDRIREWTRLVFEFALVHEIAHQWWAIGVGSDSQRHPFVDEALTNWSSLYYFEDRYGTDRARKIKNMFLKNPYVNRIEGGTGDLPANLPTSGYRDLDQYYMVVYLKGALFFGEMRLLIGDRAFFAAVREYYRRYSHRLAGPDDLRRVVLAGSPEKAAEVNELYHRWIEGANGGKDIGDAAPDEESQRQDAPSGD